jgi:8-hydroxy-5-deazaflavin:NADPH oxidoreductase
MPQEKIAMIGDGNVGSALTQGLARAGHEVEAVGREPGRVRQVAQAADVIVLAVPFGERQNALREMGDALQGKVLVDVTNALDDKMGYAVKGEGSGAQELQRMAPGAKVVKAFNTVFAQNMATGKVHGEALTAFVAGDDAGAKERVLRLARDIGFDAVDAGGLANARALEMLGILNIHLGHKQGMGPAMGIRLVHAGSAGKPQAREGTTHRA